MKKLNSHLVQKELRDRHLNLFSVQDLVSLFKVSPRAAQAFLSYNVDKGVFTRLKPNLFSLKDPAPSELAVANRLYSPSYISLFTALSHYSLIPETVYIISSVTTKPTREFEVNNIPYIYNRIKQPAYTGYIPAVIGGSTVFIATPEKAVADFLYFVYLGKLRYNDRLKWKKIDLSLLNQYMALFSKPNLAAFAKQKFNNYD